MINIIWGAMLAGGLIYMLVTGNGEAIITSVTDASSNAISLAFSLTGIYCFWMGIMNVAAESGLNEKISRLCSPVLKRIFPNASPKAVSLISMNVSSNLLGLSNAATPFGLSAMKLLHEENGSQPTPSRNMVTFAVVNACSLQLIPTTVISLRDQMGADSPSSIIVTTVITTFVSVIIGILLCKLCGSVCHRARRSKK